MYSVFSFLFFLFRNSVIREQFDENDLRHCNGNFFSKVPFQKYLIPAMFKVLSRQSRGTLTKAFERLKITIEDFTDMAVKRAPRHLTYYCMLLFLSSKPSF